MASPRPTPVLAAPSRAAAPRVPAIDVVRGLAMVVMALDHIREFWDPTPVRPEDVAHTSVLLFFTRWITHFCAPTFVFLAGASIFLYQQKQPARGPVSWFLLKRGLWLVGLEMLVINFLLQWGYSLLLLQVIWVLGWGMVALAGLIWLPRWVLTLGALGFLAGHNLLPPLQPVTVANVGRALLHNPPFLLKIGELPPLLVAYSIGPWIAVMVAGYVTGPWFLRPLAQRGRWLRTAGVGLLLLFAGLRATNWYGDPAPWSGQARGLIYSVLSFLNVTKYPPSLLFLCLISGGAFAWTKLAFGRAINLSFATINDWPAAYQPSLLRAYVVWVMVVALLYWPCRWYQGFKQRHAYWWLAYL